MDLISKFAPPTALPGLLLLWWLCAIVIGFFGGGALSGGLIVVLAFALAWLFYWASAPLDALFDEWYGGTTRGKRGLGPLASQYFPSERQLDAVREDAIRLLVGDPEAPEAHILIHGRALSFLHDRSRLHWVLAQAFALLDRFFRGLVMLSLFTALGTIVSIAFGPEIAITIPPVTLGAATVVALAFVPLCFAGFIYCRWHHLVRLYEAVAGVEEAAEAG